MSEAPSETSNNARIYSKEAEIYGVVVTRMEDKGIDTVVGVTRDNIFGSTVMFDLGGISVGLLKNATFLGCTGDEEGRR